MAFKMSSLGLTSLGLAFVLVAAVWPITAQAQTTHPIHPVYSNARFQIGELTLPVTLRATPQAPAVTPKPNGRVRLAGFLIDAGLPS